MSNTLKTTLLLGLLTGLLLLFGERVGGQQGLMIAFVMTVVMNFGSYWFSDRIVLRMYGGQEVSQQEAPGLHQMVRELANTAGIPMPRVYLLPGDSPNAFATGRNPQHAAVAVTEGIVRVLSPDELRGVLAHELAHVVHRDTLISAVAATIAGVIMMLANMARWGAMFSGYRRDDRDGEGSNPMVLLAMAIMAPLAASLIQMAISRSREFAADEAGARMAHSPFGLASALEKIAVASQRVPLLSAGPATAHLFIVNPLSGEGFARLFSTHPPTEERVRRLRALSL
jgi:heat shock protein HtpX